MIHRFEEVRVVINSETSIRVKYVENKHGVKIMHDDAFESEESAERFADWLRRESVPIF